MKTKQKKNSYFCSECGYEAYQWLGKCPDCLQWNTFSEKAQAVSESAGFERPKVLLTKEQKEKVQRLSAIKASETFRYETQFDELNRVLGGGLFSGSSLLIAGEPGIGKSTLLLQIAGELEQLIGKTKTQSSLKGNVLYISAEESGAHLKLRAERVGIQTDDFCVTSETNMDVLSAIIEEFEPAVVIVDSIQAVHIPEQSTPPGSLSQVRESASTFSRLSRELGFTLVLVGHVTKDGVLAGPKSLEHLVDTVVYFEGEKYEALRMIRAVKNRHGSTGEVGLFEMEEAGLKEIKNPSRFFLSDESEKLSGRATVAVLEGKRPFMVEVQALANETAYNNPLRRSVGIEMNRITLLLAVIEKQLSLKFSHLDLFFKSAGGFVINDPAADLAILTAICSSLHQKHLPHHYLFLGEVGLGGEIRKVKSLSARLKEAERLGFSRVYLPKVQKSDCPRSDLEFIYIQNITDLYQHLFQ